MDPAEWINASTCLFIARFESKSEGDDSTEDTFMNLAQTLIETGVLGFFFGKGLEAD